MIGLHTWLQIFVLALNAITAFITWKRDFLADLMAEGGRVIEQVEDKMLSEVGLSRKCFVPKLR